MFNVIYFKVEVNSKATIDKITNMVKEHDFSSYFTN